MFDDDTSGLPNIAENFGKKSFSGSRDLNINESISLKIHFVCDGDEFEDLLKSNKPTLFIGLLNE